MNTRSYYPSKKEIDTKWHLVDASGRILGRFATEVAKILMGKQRPTFTPGVVFGDKVVVVNADKIRVTGKKMKDKVYYRHSSYPGGLKKETLSEVMEKDATEATRRAVKGMLPTNKLTKRYLSNLYIYAGEKHPHEANISKK